MFFLGSIITFMNEIEPDSHYLYLEQTRLSKLLLAGVSGWKSWHLWPSEVPSRQLPGLLGICSSQGHKRIERSWSFLRATWYWLSPRTSLPTSRWKLHQTHFHWILRWCSRCWMERKVQREKKTEQERSPEIPWIKRYLTISEFTNTFWITFHVELRHNDIS